MSRESGQPRRRRRPHHRTLDRAAAILDTVALERAPIGLTDLAVRLGAPVSSIQSLVNGLVAVGYLTEENRRYTLGPAPFVLALRAGHRPLETVHHADLVALHEVTGLAVVLAIRVGDSAISIDATDTGDHSVISYLAERHLRLPLHTIAIGRVLLAHLPRDERLDYVTGVESADHREAFALITELDAIRRDGYYCGPSGPLFDNIAVVAAPVHEHGSVVAAVSLVGPHDRVDPHKATLPTLLTDTIRRWSTRSSGALDT
ncbi:IclR family transcriptional regulator [Nocardia terpenica]|uniref:IclR family transcriptional regulator n=1 Tax=Nocardia terpenica TaxID=455432 RepID=A0A161WNR8_9NOCA|nr:IclR family transcriptional regulator C-terminal domain-containing protein [Nocardia terpenica]KZM74725.1 hypothetical protein AWN90_21970 [Nocardia terpenica]NQE93654.1 helix-turn-helix domain-containing protein [Nocardia terpenica]